MGLKVLLTQVLDDLLVLVRRLEVRQVCAAPRAVLLGLGVGQRILFHVVVVGAVFPEPVWRVVAVVAPLVPPAVAAVSRVRIRFGSCC